MSKGARTGTGSQSEAPTNTKSLKSGRKSDGPFQTPPPSTYDGGEHGGLGVPVPAQEKRLRADTIGEALIGESGWPHDGRQDVADGSRNHTEGSRGSDRAIPTGTVYVDPMLKRIPKRR